MCMLKEWTDLGCFCFLLNIYILYTSTNSLSFSNIAYFNPHWYRSGKWNSANELVIIYHSRHFIPIFISHLDLLQSLKQFFINVSYHILVLFVCFVWFDSLRPINNLSVIQGRVFLGWTSTKLGGMCLAQGPQRSDDRKARTRGPSVTSQTLYHWATGLPHILVVSITLMTLFWNRAIRVGLATSIWYDTLMKNCFKDWSQSISHATPWIRLTFDPSK